MERTVYCGRTHAVRIAAKGRGGSMASLCSVISIWRKSPAALKQPFWAKGVKDVFGPYI